MPRRRLTLARNYLPICTCEIHASDCHIPPLLSADRSAAGLFTLLIASSSSGTASKFNYAVCLATVVLTDDHFQRNPKRQILQSSNKLHLIAICHYLSICANGIPGKLNAISLKGVRQGNWLSWLADVITMIIKFAKLLTPNDVSRVNRILGKNKNPKMERPIERLRHRLQNAIWKLALTWISPASFC